MPEPSICYLLPTNSDNALFMLAFAQNRSVWNPHNQEYHETVFVCCFQQKRRTAACGALFEREPLPKAWKISSA
ncbi:hypothetical protein M404DRAFT_995078 [Pisolithus tinctorius Marx 270]|uniref:Uncharacterized protein n=1 Tax=Pisolithus tinctorius Marx 270 TaxID=870435 RepID=A0A0C3KPC1_PISTI|nr:hypothetical protein M404DRAFT_995078 [Pisolithus tinctorius Marx 270]